MRDTACFSMYSDMSTRIMALSESNRYWARARHQLRLADAGRPEEDEAADGPVGVAQSRRGCAGWRWKPVAPLHPARRRGL